MKKSLVFILGIISGIILTLAFAVIFSISYSDDVSDVHMFEQPGKVIEVSHGFRVIQVMDANSALVVENNLMNNRLGIGITALLVSKDEYFYINQDIRLEKGVQEFRQIGVYTYLTKDERQMTVPIIQIFEKQ